VVEKGLLEGGTFFASTNTAATGLEAGCSDVLVHGQSNAISIAAFRVQSVQLGEPAEPTRAANVFCQPDFILLRSALFSLLMLTYWTVRKGALVLQDIPDIPPPCATEHRMQK
jgi:hypothetical protein